ncbi:MAG: ERG2 family protein [Proteobacteria bacterium]|nr:ERG2 family protein [Pseudomonadota bacterium]
MGFVFDPETLGEIVRGVVGQPMPRLLPQLTEELERAYPGHIRRPDEWVFNNAGGAMGAMTILHASLTEYVILFGTPIGTEGHSGRFWAEDFFYILEGEQWAYEPGELVRQVYKPGDMHRLPRGRAQGYRIPEHCWALEYARGAIPLMLPFGFADTFTSTLDFPTLWRTLRIYGASVLRELSQGKV